MNVITLMLIIRLRHTYLFQDGRVTIAAYSDVKDFLYLTFQGRVRDVSEDEHFRLLRFVLGELRPL